jgi:DNA-binding transcriptional LysR family regulator
LKQLGYAEAPVLETSNLETQKKIVLEGFGFTVMPRMMVENELGEGLLAEIKTGRRLLGDVYEVRHKDAVISEPLKRWTCQVAWVS